MLGAIIGDIVGSRFEWHNIKSKDFDFFHERCRVTDDSVLSLAVCEALCQFTGDYTKLGADVTKSLHTIGNRYPNAGYGAKFRGWLYADNPKPYNSLGNGAAMRVSGCGYVADSIPEVKRIAQIVTGVTHNHPEGLKAGEATAVGVLLARQGKSMAEIKAALLEYYLVNFTLDEIRPTYKFDVTSQGSMPYALEAFFESTSFEDAIRNAISIGGDSDTLGAITGGIAEAYYGIKESMRAEALSYLPTDLREIVQKFEEKYPPKIIKG